MSEWTVATLKAHFDAELDAHARLGRAQEKALRRALRLQAREYERRLRALNGENQRILNVQNNSVTAEKFDDYKTTQETALKIALDRQDDRLKSLEDWKARAIGMGVVLVLFAGAVGAAVMRALSHS